MIQKRYYKTVIERFEKNLPDADTELVFHDTYELIVAVMLSAQCTDKRINMVTPDLFAAYPNVVALSKADVADVFEYIKTVSYPNAKSKHLCEMARIVVDKFGGEIPQEFDELVTLPGVGRKTANVVVSHAFGKPCIAVDTHVFCVSHRLGLVPKSCNTPLKTERYLTSRVPKDKQLMFHFWLLEHGKRTCTLRKAKCDGCFLNDVCRKIF